mgnify:CR=1 FL=1
MFETPQSASALHRFAKDYHQAIQYAALRLGGPVWQRRAGCLLDDLSHRSPITRRVLKKAQELSALFAGEIVPDVDSSEPPCREDCNPEASQLDEIRILAVNFSEAVMLTATQTGRGSTVSKDGASCKT